MPSTIRWCQMACRTGRERATIASCTRLQRGAVPAEVRSVLQSVARWARSELERLRADAAFVDAAAADRLERRRTEDAEIAALGGRRCDREPCDLNTRRTRQYFEIIWILSATRRWTDSSFGGEIGS